MACGLFGLGLAAAPVHGQTGAAGTAQTVPAAQKGGDSRGGTPPPALPARPPAARTLAYDLQFGAVSGRGQLQWTPSVGRYQARMEGRFAGLTLLQWTSEGRLLDTGLAPDRFADRRMGGREDIARFDHAGGRVRYSGGAADRALPAPSPMPAQDRLSWMLQLAALAEGLGRPLVPGDRFSLWVSGARGDAEDWTFRCVGREALRPEGPSPGGAGSGGSARTTGGAWRLVRDAKGAGDTRVEVWLDPAREHLPVRAVLQSARNDDRLELTVRP